jgi:signal transduction histidine kinase/ligand-binding sensor domain-containing protein
MLTCSQRAFALNPSLDISQYAHTSWKIRDGFAKGTITTIAQTPDGYLWLGTDYGLLRFDGVRAVPWEPPPGQALPATQIHKLLVTRDGALWIGTPNGLARWKDARLTQFAELAGRRVGELVEDRDGTVWANGRFLTSGRLCAVRDEKVQCVGDDGAFGDGPFGLFLDRSGNLWTSTQSGLWRWKPGLPRLYARFALPNGVQGFAEDDYGLLVAMPGGIARVRNGEAEMTYPLPIGPTALRLFRDRDGALWTYALDRGLIHLHRGRVDSFGIAEGLSGNRTDAFFEDREGSIWVVTDGGLDRFRELAVATVSLNQGILSNTVFSVLATGDGSVWIGTSAGLNRWTNGAVTIPRTGRGVPDGRLDGQYPNSLFQDREGRLWVSTSRGVGYLEGDRYVSIDEASAISTIHPIVQDSGGSVWIANQKQGLFRVSRSGSVQRTAWDQLGRQDYAFSAVADHLHGGLWLGFFQGGIIHLSEGRIRASYGAAEGLGSGVVGDLRLDPDGVLWAATAGGLSRLKNGRIATLTSRNGLPCDGVQWIQEDNLHFVWLGTACGLVRIPRSELDHWSHEVEERNARTQAVHPLVFDISDGVRSRPIVAGMRPVVTKSSDGTIWFKNSDGIGVFDPARLPGNSLMPPVHVEQVIADRTLYDAAAGHGQLRLPPLVRDLQIDYTALSLVAPERNQFQYKLEGYDRGWQNVGNRRQAFYTNLSPGNYRFRVKASNNSGVWNETGAALDFSIAPAYYQTSWFRTLAVVAFATLLWAAYRYRVRQVAHAFDERLQERVNERTRIARELHDTLLQSFHGLLFRFQAANNMLPDRPVEAKEKFDAAIDQAAQAITEGRDAVQNLRSTVVEANDLAFAITTLGEELVAADMSLAKPTVNVAVEGTPRDLHPIIRDDLYRIAGEALRNAYRHAQARHIEVELRYDERQLQLRVRDDGRGIDPAVLEQRKEGHFGLPGIRERADLIGGHLDVWSQAGIGTEVDLKVPAHAAYATPRSRSRIWPFAGRMGTPS